MLGRIDLSVRGPQLGEALGPHIREGEAFVLMMRFLDADLVATGPDTIRYRIDDLDRGDAVLDWTSLDVESWEQCVVVTSAQNAIRSNKSTERRQIVVEADDGDGPLRRTLEYRVLNLQGA